MFALSHHSPEELNRCYRFGTIHVCARCLGTYPVMFAAIAAQFWYQCPLEHSFDLVLGVGLILPATIDWALGCFQPHRFSNLWRTGTGALLGLGLGRTLFIHFQRPMPLALLVQLILVAAVVPPVVFMAYGRRLRVRSSPLSIRLNGHDTARTRLGPATSDEQLMLAFKSGDARAFSTLVQRHRGPVFNFVLRYVGHRQRAEDLLQETWLKVVRNSGEWQPKARFTTWVYTIARNLCVDSARKESFRRAESLDAPVSRDEPAGRSLGELLPDEEGAHPDRAAHNARIRPMIESALQGLPAEQREVFLLREYQGIGFKEIAEVTGVNENTVKSRMRYALEGLRKRLAELGVTGEAAGADGPSAEGRTVA